VRKNSGEISICVDFIYIKRTSIKDNYSLPNMEMLLQHVNNSALISMLNEILGYNQVIFVE
jgi:hypothetical protein